MSDQLVACGSCGVPIDEPADLPIEDRTPCLQCGSTARKLSVHLKAVAKAQVGVGFKHKRPGRKKPIAEGFTGRQLRTAVGDYVYKERLIDRENDRYREKIVTNSGEVIHDVDEPLSKHRGYGSAKIKTKWYLTWLGKIKRLFLKKR